MQLEKPLYIIRSYELNDRGKHEEGIPSGAMSLEKIIKYAKSGHWGGICVIDEVYDFRMDFPSLLRRVAMFSRDTGFTMIEVDEEYSRFLSNLGIEEPQSPALNEQKSAFV